MRLKLIDIFRNNKQVLVIILFWIGIIISNYKPGTWLVGWDNTMPELNFSASFNKSFYGIWQEYRGLGVLDGMAHTANIVHLCFIFLISKILPLKIIRYFFIFLMHLSGGLGMYFLLWKKIFKKIENNKWISVFGALFYMFNIGVVQMFFIPLELFVIHFGFLPWLFIVLINLVENQNKKNILWFFSINLLAISQAHVPSIFIAYIVGISLYLLNYYLNNKDFSKKKKLKVTGLVFLILFSVNAFWGLPYFYSGLNNAKTITASKINQLSNPEIVLRNKAFGDFKNTAVFKGFNFDYYDFISLGRNDLMMEPWINHFDKLGVNIIAWIFFALTLTGIFFIVKNKNKELYGFVLIFITCFLLLGNDIPILSFISMFLNNYVPLFEEVFRFVFTKFIILYAFSYSILLVLGFSFIVEKIKNNFLRFLSFFIFVLILIFYTLPSFSGNFIYEKLKIVIPNEYFDTFDYFKKQNINTRIAVLPSPNFWGWTTNEWGFRGSGFVWYGIGQPMMDRAFDPWSSQNEQYYWELYYVINTGDKDGFLNILDKYDIDWILFDTTILDTINNNKVNKEKFKQFFESINRISLEKQFGDIYVYKVESNEIKKDYVSLWNDLPNVSNNFNYSWKDEVYGDYGEYISNQKSVFSDQLLEKNIIYPFSSLFTNRLQEDLEFEVSEDSNYIILTKKNTDNLDGLKNVVDNFVETERYIFARLKWEKTENKALNIKVEYLTPEFELGNKVYKSDVNSEMNLSLKDCEEDKCFLTLNYENNFDINKESSGEVLLYSTRSNVVGVYSGTGVNLYDYDELDLAKIKNKFVYKEEKLNSDSKDFIVRIPKVSSEVFDKNILSRYLGNNKENCRENLSGFFDRKVVGDVLKYKAITASSCDHMYIDSLWHDQSYLIKITSKNVSSIPIKFGVQNVSLGTSVIDTFLSDKREFTDNIVVIPPMEKFHKGYTLFFDTVSFGKEVNENELKSIKIWPIPYEFIKNVKLVSDGVSKGKSLDGFEVNKKAIWLYEINLNDEILRYVQNDDIIMKLSQGYNDGWLAFSQNENGKWNKLYHVKVNNWANGWKISNQNLEISNQIYIVFWPQLLEYLGFGILIGVLGWVGLKKINKIDLNLS